MAARITCSRVLATEHRQEVVVVFPKSLRTRFVEFWPYCGELLWRAIRWMCDWLGKGGIVFFVVLAFAFAFFAVIFFVSLGWIWIPIMMEHCHKSPGVALDNFIIRDMTAVQSRVSDSPWQVNSAFNATFSTWNRNTIAKCFTTYRIMDVRVEYRGQVILQQQVPLGFSLKPQASRPFSMELKGDYAAQLKKELGPVMQAEMRSGNITLNFFYDIRYLIADRRSKWKSSGCVVISNSTLDSSALKTMVAKDCYIF